MQLICHFGPKLIGQGSLDQITPIASAKRTLGGPQRYLYPGFFPLHPELPPITWLVPKMPTYSQPTLRLGQGTVLQGVG